MIAGERWEDERRATLLAVYDSGGRLQRTFMDMDSNAIRDNLLVYEPVIVSGALGDRVLAAEPTSYRILIFEPSGRQLGTIAEEPDRYVGPSPLPSELPPPALLWDWLSHWTPLVFLHATSPHLFRALKLPGPREGYQVEVLSHTGKRLGEPMEVSLRPLCALGERIFFVSHGQQDSELFAYDYTGTQ